MNSEATFEQFVARESPALLRTAVLMTGDRKKAEDLIQDTLLKAWRNWGKVSNAQEPAAYVRRILLNIYLKAADRRWNGEVPSDEVERTDSSDFVLEVHARQDLFSALRQLTPGQRTILVLRFYQDLTEQQTADALGCSVGTVKSQTSRGLRSLRGALENAKGVKT